MKREEKMLKVVRWGRYNIVCLSREEAFSGCQASTKD